MQITDAMIEAGCRAAVAASRPSHDPDMIVPGPRGQLGMWKLWQTYERLVRPAIEAALEASSAPAQTAVEE